MSYSLAIGLIAALDAFIVAAVACTCLVPFVIDKPKSPRTLVAVDLMDMLPDVAEVVPGFVIS